MRNSGFRYRDDELFCEGVALETVVGEVGTPCYVYSASTILENYRSYGRAFGERPHAIHYAVKANSSIGVLALLADEGAGFDIVSGGELFRVLRAGGNAAKVVFSGVGKTAAEIRYALQEGVGYFNCESEAELLLLDEIAGAQKARPSVALRVNPDVDAETHPYIATGLRVHKFGVDIRQAERIYLRATALTNVRLEGISCHIGSQIVDVGVFVDVVERLLELAASLRQGGVHIAHLDLGGGLGILYRPVDPSPSIDRYVDGLASTLDGSGLTVMLEPGRSIVGAAGQLVTRVLYRKRNGSKEFVVVDAAMNDLLRPALYQAEHAVLVVGSPARASMIADVVGPICETGDFLARDREVPVVEPGELVAVCTAGAYGFSLASNYNSRPRAAEVLVRGDAFEVIRSRESLEDLVRGERRATFAG